MINIILTIFCALISSCLYRAGGLSKEQPYWIPVWMRKSWIRDWLCPFFCLLPLFIQTPSWWFIPAYGLMGGAFSTYWDWVYKNRDNYWLAGWGVGLSFFPLIFIDIDWQMFLIRALFLAVSWGAFCAIFGNDHAEEHARGFFAGIASIIS